MLIIFDLDGTLFQAKPVMLRAATRLLNDLGVAEPDEKRILETAPNGAASLLQEFLGDVPDGAVNCYEELMHDAIIECGELFPGVTETVRQLASDGHELVVCSNSPEQYIDLVLESTGIAKWISRYYSAEPYASKAELAGLLVKANTPAVVIGDTHGDMEAAHINNLPAIAAMYGYGNKQMLAEADGFAYSAEDILSIVSSLLLS